MTDFIPWRFIKGRAPHKPLAVRTYWSLRRWIWKRTGIG